MMSRERMPTIPDLYFGSTKLAVEKELSILGVTFDSKLLWSRHISDIAKKKLGRDLQHCGRMLMNWIP